MEKAFGVIGLGKMGGGLALHARDKGWDVFGFDPHPRADLQQAGIQYVDTLKGFVDQMKAPRVIFMWIPAGTMVDDMADRLAHVLEKGDVIVDGGNSYWGDTLRRAQKYAQQGLHFVDLGTSGGIEGARNSPCFMMGCSDEALPLVEPILQDLATPGGYVHAGGSGAGHYTKLVHNGIEFGMLQAIGEGLELLERFPMKLNIGETLECWRNGSVIRSWLIDLMARSYKADPALSKCTGYIEDTGEVNWLVSDALNLDVPIPVIAQAVMALMRSREKRSISDNAIIAMRHEFGGHPFGPEPGIRAEREHGRVGDIFRFSDDRKAA